MSAQGLYGEFEAVLNEHRALHRCGAIEARQREEHDADLSLVFADRSWLQSTDGDSLVAAFQAHPKTASARRRKSTIYVRLDDQVLVDLERRLAAGEPQGMATGDVSAGQRVTVSYANPNTNKALHVGHLRNLVTGEALASAFSSAGAVVRRHNLVGDIGRRVCEAMAGYLTFHEGKDPEDEGLTGDRFVELCFRDYARERGRLEPNSDEGDPNAEERKPVGDLADALMRDWLLEKAPARQLWGRMRDLVLEGHRHTFNRLGVAMDHWDFESDAVPRAFVLVEEGLKLGIFERDEVGVVIHRTGRSEYPTVVLIREDGFPTEHARLLGVYDHIFEDLAPDELYMEVAGIEWQPAVAVLRAMLEMLRPGPRNETDVRVFHGSLTFSDGKKIGSSGGDVVWIDDFLDDIAAGPGIAALEELGNGAVSRENLVDILLRGAFLCSPASRSLAFSPQALLEGSPSPGWTIAEAWCRAQLAKGSGEEPAPVARTAVMQSQQYRRVLSWTVENRDVTNLARHLLSLSEAFLAVPDPGPAAAPILTRVLNSLGFLAGRTGSSSEYFDGAGSRQGVSA